MYGRLIIVMAILATTGLALAPRAAAQSGWQAGPSLSTERAWFPLVELPSGALLAAGGLGSGGIAGITAAEVLNVQSPSRAWRSIAPMPAGHRDPHQALRLVTGEVLVTGDEYGVAQPQANLFREATGTWTSTANAPLANRFQGHLTGLPDGRVLYSGGYGGGSGSDTYASAELYDPATRLWRPTGDMLLPRFGHGAVLLTSGPEAGEVLVAGGEVRALDNALDTCELYDPLTGSWRPAAPMHVARLLFTMTTLPDGRVLVAGGMGDYGRGEIANRRDVEIYDPRSSRWLPAAPLAEPRARHSATLLPDGRVLVAGGAQRYGEQPTSSVEIYDPTADRWESGPSLRGPRSDHSAALLPQGGILVAGGRGPDGAVLATTELLGPLTGPELTPTARPTTPTPSPTAPRTETAPPSATPTPPGAVCPQIVGRVPAAAIAAALANPARVRGYRELLDPGKPAGPRNPPRTWLTLRALAVPYHALFNGLEFKAGCP